MLCNTHRIIVMESYRDVIDAFGGYADFAKAVGIRPGTASSLRSRQSLPVVYWEKTIQAATAQDISGITYALLIALSQKKRAA